MAKKKALQKNTQSILLTVIVVIASLAILGASSIITTVNLLSNTVVKVNGDKVTKAYFNYYLYNQKMYYESFGGADIWGYDTGDSQTFESQAKSSALNTATSMKISKQKAAELNLQLTDEDNAKIETSLEETKTALGEEGMKLIGASDNDLRNILTEQIIADKLYEELTKGFEMSEDEFEVYFQNYLETNHQTLTQIDADYIHTATLEEANEAMSKINAGNDFIEVLKATSTDYDPEQDYASITVSTSILPQEAVDAAFSVSAGQVTPVVETESQGCYIIRVNSITEPNAEELRPEQQETYIKEMKQEIFDSQFKVWTDASDIDVNAEVYTTTTIKSISPKTTPAPESTDEAIDGTDGGTSDVPQEEPDGGTDGDTSDVPQKEPAPTEAE